MRKCSYFRANECIFALMNVSSHYWSPFHAKDCVFSRNEQQKVQWNISIFYYLVVLSRLDDNMEESNLCSHFICTEVYNPEATKPNLICLEPC